MPRRVSLPGAEELFRTATARAEEHRDRSAPPGPDSDGSALQDRTPERAEASERVRDQDAGRPAPGGKRSGKRGGSGRVRHDEKITVYVSRDELLALERARLGLRAEYQMAVDRGRIVREALALVLDDLAEHGEESELVRRLTQP